MSGSKVSGKQCKMLGNLGGESKTFWLGYHVQVSNGRGPVISITTLCQEQCFDISYRNPTGNVTDLVRMGSGYNLSNQLSLQGPVATATAVVHYRVVNKAG